MKALEVREVKCKSLLHTLDYGSETELTANFYKGCAHGCVYCYVPSLIHDERDWGRFVDVKINAPAVLEEETRRIDPRMVFLSSATDPYQPLEARYGITRRCLEILHKRGFPATILTRSPLVLRDIDLLKQFEWLRVGFSISTVPVPLFEPGVAPLQRRLDCLRRLHSEGITTWVSLAPIIPGRMLLDLEWLVPELRRAGVSVVYPGLLRFQTYQASEQNFERATGLSLGEVMRDHEETLERVKLLISENDMDDPGSTMRWIPPAGNGVLDPFLSVMGSRLPTA